MNASSERVSITTWAQSEVEGAEPMQLWRVRTDAGLVAMIGLPYSTSSEDVLAAAERLVIDLPSGE